MAMRMTDKQRSVAEKLGTSAFMSSLALSHQMPEAYPLTPKWAYIDDPAANLGWEGHFRRNDITDDNRRELNAIFYKGYEDAYFEYMVEAMTPETQEQYDRRIHQEQSFAQMMSVALNHLGR